MVLRGKSINLFLLDGTSSGIIKCSLANWTGIAYKIPRTKLDECRTREDLKQSGVYFLFGSSDITGKDVVYIGQAGARKNGEGILNRLQEHRRNPDKDYWIEAVAFITSNNSFGPTEISYLENKFCNLARQANRYEIKNGNDPTLGNVTEEKESELENFIDYAKVVMSALGHKIFEPIRKEVDDKGDKTQKTTNTENRRLYLKRNITNVGLVEAVGTQISDGFTVLKDSYISPIDDDTIPEVIKQKRKMAAINEQGILTEDILLSSPSYAAMFVIGKSANGLTSWKDEAGNTLKQLEANDN